MLKVIDLDIDPEITGETGVWEVAWVEMPAIEQELIYFSEQRFFKAPEYVSATACRAIKENEKRGNPAATQVGKIRGQQLCNRDEISLETVKRMKSYLERAKTYYTGNYDDNGTISYDLWGGENGLKWVDSILSKEEDMAEVGPKGGIRESEKAPKSDTPNPDPKGEGTARGDASSTRGAEVTERVENILKDKSDDFNERYKDKLGYGVNVGMLKSVYQRGVGAYNTSHSPSVQSAEQWALARVNAFLYLVKNGRPENPKYNTDFDLLPSQHPKKEKMYDMEFVYPSGSETKDEFIGRCMGEEQMVEEYPDTAQRYAVCQSYWERKGEFALDRVSFDWDGTLTTPRGKELLEQELGMGNLVYIISARSTMSKEISELANKYDIPSSKIFMTGSNPSKIEKVKELGIIRHYDDNLRVLSELGKIGQRFDYDTGGLPPYTQYPDTGATNAMLVEPVLPPVLFEDCGCNKKQDFNLVGYIDGQPVFSSPEEAEMYGENQMGCSGHHIHTDENGNEVYMACEMHPEVKEDMGVELEDLIAKGWKIESIGPVQNIEAINNMAKEAFSKITKEEFYVIKTNPNGFSALDQPGGNKIRFIYAVGPGMGAQLIKTSREFCMRMLGGRQFVFRYEDILDLNAQIFAQDSTSRKIIPRPKGTDPDIFQWKGGANCRHIWIQLIFSSGLPDEGYSQEITNDTRKMQRDAALVTPANGQGGNVNPKARPVSGDRLEAFSSDIMPEYWDNPELIPVGYLQGLPVFDEIVDAQDASYFLNCGGVTEQVDYMGKRRFQACSYSAKKAEKQEQIFKSIDEKKMVYTPLMIPNILIPRMDDMTGERYYVKFKPEVIEKIQQKFMIEQRLRETNYEHTDKKFKDIVMVESWIVGGDSDKAYSLGFTKEQIPQGTWMAGYKFLDTKEADDVWNNYVKKGKVKGASVEGNFILNFSRDKKDEYLLSEIINILKKIK